MTRAGTSLCAAGLMTMVAGCADTTSGARRPERVGAEVLRSGVVTPFAPAAIRVHPLTQISRDGAGSPVIVLHIELLDAWRDGVKGVGLLRVDVSGEGESRRWDVNLYDMSINAPAYDPATRTYRLQLEKLPAWLSERGGQARARIRATLQTLDSRGEAIELFDEVDLR